MEVRRGGRRASDKTNERLHIFRVRFGRERKASLLPCLSIGLSDERRTVPINSRLNVVVRSPTPFGLGRNGCWPSQGSQLSRAFPFIFLLCCPLNDHRSAAHSFFKIGRLFSLFLFSCTPLAPLCLLILLLLLMSGKVHPNPGPMFPLLCVCWKCDLAEQVSAMLRLLQIGPSKVLTTFPLQALTLGATSPPCQITVAPPRKPPTCIPPLYNLASPLLMQHSCPILVSKPIPDLPTDGRTDSFSPSILPSSRNLFILGDFNCHHPLWDSRVTSDPHWEEVFDWVISSDLLPLNDPDTSTLLHRSFLSCVFLLLGGASGPGL